VEMKRASCGPENSLLEAFVFSAYCRIYETYQYVAFGLLSAIVGKEGGVPIEALVQNDANALPVASSVILQSFTSSDHFRCHVLASSNNRIRRDTVATSVSLAQKAKQILIVCHTLPFMTIQYVLHRL
jgi:hypothetical protein